MLPAPRSRASIAATVAFIFVALSLYNWHSEALELSTSLDSLRLKKSRPAADFERISNETLGTQRILVVSLPERTDKRDALTLSASITGIKLHYIDAAHGEEVSDKALPPAISRKAEPHLTEPEIGCWRGHMRAIRHIVDNSLSTALILEDDVDWDLRLKTQLVQFAHGSRELLPYVPHSHIPHSPYGDDFDVLWIGHCGEKFREDGDERTYIIPNDPSVPDFEHLSGGIDWKKYPEHTRFVHPSRAPICTNAYIVSFKGAQKILYRLSVKGYNNPWDNALARACLDGGDVGLRCISANPEYFYQHRPAGVETKGSDIQTLGANGEVRDKGFTRNIVWSVRANYETWLRGEEPVLQW